MATNNINRCRSRSSTGVIDGDLVAWRMLHHPLSEVSDADIPESGVKQLINACNTQIPGELETRNKQLETLEATVDEYQQEYNYKDAEVQQCHLALCDAKRRRKIASENLEREEEARLAEENAISKLKRKQTSTKQLFEILGALDCQRAGKKLEQKATAISKHFWRSDAKFIAEFNGPSSDVAKEIVSKAVGLALVHTWKNWIQSNNRPTIITVYLIRPIFNQSVLKNQYNEYTVVDVTPPDQMCDIIDVLVKRKYLQVHAPSPNALLWEYTFGKTLLQLMNGQLA